MVKDPKIDSKSQEGAEPYKSPHSHLVERMLAGWGCSDIYRIIHPTEPGFTRLCDSVHTRIDRLFADNDQHKWTELEPDSLFWPDGSDHTPLIGCIATPKLRPPNQKDGMIHPHVLPIFISIYLARS